MNPTPQPPGYVLWVVRTLEEAGYETWTVGGATLGASAGGLLLFAVVRGEW